MASSVDLSPEVIFFLGAGASIHAGIGGVEGMVTKFLKRLEDKYGSLHHATTKDIFESSFGLEEEPKRYC